MPRERTDDARALAEYAAERACREDDELRATPTDRQEQHRTAHRRRDFAYAVADAVAPDDVDWDG